MRENTIEGILPVNKPKGNTSFSLVRLLRKHLGIKKIGHAGTLDPFATGVMVMLLGRQYTRLSDSFLNEDKEYLGRVQLGAVTDTFDCEGTIIHRSNKVPEKEEIAAIANNFQGEIQQVPPMYSAKKRGGKKLYQLARLGQTVEREPITVQVETEVIAYAYPFIDIRVRSSKGTYIRSIAHDMGTLLGCGGHLLALTRIRSGIFHLADCLDGIRLEASNFRLTELSEKICRPNETVSSL
ncbi:MAG: tRNA pseudouridine(55) synthase TruB [Waddliaceae bacterium]